MSHDVDEQPDVCGWCGFTPTGGNTQTRDDVTYCHGPGIPAPTCWQYATSDGAVVQGDFGQ